jgi:hypothetical protein
MKSARKALKFSMRKIPMIIALVRRKIAIKKSLRMKAILKRMISRLLLKKWLNKWKMILMLKKIMQARLIDVMPNKNLKRNT